MSSKRIYVYADWSGLAETSLMGILWAEKSRGDEIFSFGYDKEWLKSNDRMMLDPDLQWYSGPQYLKDEKVNFGMFLDSSPDRWGRLLMHRREAHISRMEQRKQKILMPSDYLLGVYDEHRMGGLRFKDSPDGPFLNDSRDMAAPPWTSLRDLEFASSKLEAGDSADDPDYPKWLNQILAPGSSLGGARPKAGVLDQSNHLWIAKFPSINDMVDVGGWEMVTHDLALKSGINMSDAMAQKFAGRQYTYLTKRFDRTARGMRIHFASAMTLLGRRDGEDFHSGLSYLDLVGFILQHGDKNHIDTDLEELWKRIVFSICVKNTDDHLSNHGFILGNHGWRLSPAFDINPIPTGTELTLNITDVDNSLSVDLALEVAGFFRIEEQKAGEIVKDIQKNVNTWRSHAKKYGLSGKEQEIMSAAFES